jgi:hypothetical protein
MTERRLNIVEFIRHPDVLNDQSHSDAQLTFLKSIYGLALSPKEMEIYRRRHRSRDLRRKRAQGSNDGRRSPKRENK